MIGQRNAQNKISAAWLKTAGFLDTKEQDKINYIFVPPKKVESNKIPGDSGHFIRAEIENTDLKKENLASKIRTKSNKEPYQKPKIDRDNTDKTVKMLEDIAKLEPGKKCSNSCKKYK